MSDRVIQLLVNWALVLTSPFFVIPVTIYFMIRDKDIKQILMTGEKALLE